MHRNGSRDKNASTKQQILRAARKLFAQHGYEATTTRMITEQVGVSQSAISFHFDSKENLCRAAVEYTAGLIGAYYEQVYGEIDRAFKAGRATGETAVFLISRLLAKQISLVFDPRNQNTVNLALKDKSFPQIAQGILPNELFDRVEGQLSRLILAYSKSGNAVWAAAVSRAANGAIFAFFEKPSLMREMRSLSSEGDSGRLEGYVLDFLLGAIKNCASPDEPL